MKIVLITIQNILGLNFPLWSFQEIFLSSLECFCALGAVHLIMELAKEKRNGKP